MGRGCGDLGGAGGGVRGWNILKYRVRTVEGGSENGSARRACVQ